MMMATKVVPEMVVFKKLIWLIAKENFTNVSHRESITYIQYLNCLSEEYEKESVRTKTNNL
jgi:hypothetical protein